MQELDLRIFTFKKLLPEKIHVRIFKDDAKGEVWAKILELPECNAHVKDVNSLPKMVTDLVLTCFEVPQNIQGQLGKYVPVYDNQPSLAEILRILIELETNVETHNEVKAIFRRVEFIWA